MKARVERDAIRRALRTVLPAVGKTSLAVLNGVHIVADKGLRLTCTDLNLTITAEVDANVGTAGALVVPARLLANFADKAPEGSVTIELTDQDVLVTAGDATATLHALPVDEWPKLHQAEGEGFVLTATHVDRIRRILPFASIDRNRGVIQGLHLAGDAAWCTDSYRLGKATLDGLDLPPTTIPAPAFVAALKGAEGDVTVAADDHRATLSHQGGTFTTVLLEGNYPPVGRLLRDKSPLHLTLNSGRLVEALERTGVLRVERPTSITQDGDKAIVHITESDVGEITDVLPCDGDFSQTIAFNPTFLVQLCEAADTDDITLGLVDSLKPVEVEVEGLRLLIMPVKAKA